MTDQENCHENGVGHEGIISRQESNDDLAFVPDSLKDFIEQAEEDLVATRESMMTPYRHPEIKVNRSMISMDSEFNDDGEDAEMTEDDDDRSLKEEILRRFTPIKEVHSVASTPSLSQLRSDLNSSHERSSPLRQRPRQVVNLAALKNHPAAKELQHSSSVLIDHLFEYLSTCPPEESFSNDQAGRRIRQRGLTLPASALGWLSSQLYPDDERGIVLLEYNGRSNNTIAREDHSIMESSMTDRLTLLKFLLKRITHLRITATRWPETTKRIKRRQQETKIITEGNHQQQDSATETRTAALATPGRDASFTAVSVQSVLTNAEEPNSHNVADGTPLNTGEDNEDGFISYFDELQHSPRIDLRMFPNLSVLLLDRIPPEWIDNIWCLQCKLELLRFEHGCIYDVPSFLFPTSNRKTTYDDIGTNNRSDREGFLETEAFDPVVSLLEESTLSMEPSQISMTQVYSNLTHLKLNYCCIGELSGLLGKGDDIDAIDYIPPPLSRLPNLKSLSLAHNELINAETALAGLACLPMLTKLDLSHNRLMDMDQAFMMLGNVTVLVLSGNQIRNVRGLDRLYSLEKLFLDRNLIKDVVDVAGLSHLPCLNEVDLRLNPLENKHSSRRTRVEILNFFKESRFASLPRNATYRQLLEILPILDGKAATNKELYGLRLLTFNQSVTYRDSTDAGFVVVNGLRPSNRVTTGNQTRVSDEMIMRRGAVNEGVNTQHVSYSTGTKLKAHNKLNRITRIKKQQKAVIQDGSGVSAFVSSKKRKKRKKKKTNVQINSPGEVGFASLLSDQSECYIGDIAEIDLNDDSTRGSTDFSLKDVISTLPADSHLTETKERGGNNQNRAATPSHFDAGTALAHQDVHQNPKATSKTDDEESKEGSYSEKQPAGKRAGINELEDFIVPKKRAPVRSGGFVADSLQQKRREVRRKSIPLNEKENVSRETNEESNLVSNEINGDKNNQSFGSSAWEKALEANFNKGASSTEDNIKSAVSSISGVESDQSPRHSRNNSLTLVSNNGPVTSFNEGTFPDVWSDNDQPTIQGGDNFHIWEDDDCSSAQSNLNLNMEDFPAEAKFHKEEEDSVYDGPESYRRLHVRVNIELYFRSFVFPPPQNSQLIPKTHLKETGSVEKSSILMDEMPRIQLCALDHDEMLHTKPDLLSYRENFRHLWNEEVLACGKLATSRLRPNRAPKRGFHGDIMFNEGKLETTSECRRVLLCTSDIAFYIISDYDAVTAQAQRKALGNKRKFPLPIPKDSLFQHAVWPHAVARHPIQSLYRITIGFGFQRLTLHFKSSAYSAQKKCPRNDEYAYIIILSNKIRAVSLLQQLQDHVKESTLSHDLKDDSTSITIDNDDKRFLDSLAAAISPNPLGVVFSYQILLQRWKHGDRGAVRRVCVVTDTNLYLLDEAYIGDGSSIGTLGEEDNISSPMSPSNYRSNGGSPGSVAFNTPTTPLGDVKFALVDFAELSRIDEVHAADADPRSITIIVRPSSSFLRPHRWRLQCRDGDAAEKLVDDVRKAIEQIA